MQGGKGHWAKTAKLAPPVTNNDHELHLTFPSNIPIIFNTN